MRDDTDTFMKLLVAIIVLIFGIFAVEHSNANILMTLFPPPFYSWHGRKTSEVTFRTACENKFGTETHNDILSVLAADPSIQPQSPGYTTAST